jgi:hypothetical protein
MPDRFLSPGLPENRHRRAGAALARWLTASLALVVLAGCEHGNLSFDQSTGRFNLPIGAGSHEPGTTR